MTKDNSQFHRVSKYMPWLIFALYMAWWWRVDNIFVSIPAYGDVLEVIWGTEWVASVIQGSYQAPYLFHSLTYYPEGWHINTFAQGIGTFILLYPFFLAGGAALAYNAGGILAAFVAFAGMFRLSQRYVGRLAAFSAALAFTFWAFRYIHHLNVFISSGLLPWMVLGLEKGWSSKDGRKYAWYTFVGLLWAIAISTSLYFIWIGGLFIVGWAIGHFIAGKKRWQTLFFGAGLAAFLALVFSSLFIYWFWQGREAAHSPFYDIYHMNVWGSSLNSLPIPSLIHPWLDQAARAVYSGMVNESSVVNLGIVASILVLISPILLRGRRRQFAPLFIVTITGLVLAVGPFLKWNDKAIQLDAARPINALAWNMGHALKPLVFQESEPIDQYAEAVPGLELFLSAVIPFWEGARVSSRYALVSGVGFFLLAAAVIDRLRDRWWVLVLIGLLMFEVIPQSFAETTVPVVDVVHPAYTWLAEQDLGDESIADTRAIAPNVMDLNLSAATLWATKIHQRPTLAGAGSIWPGHIVFLNDWLRTHPRPFENPDLIPMLRSYGVRYLFIHDLGDYGATLIDNVSEDGRFELIECFAPSPTRSPWPYTICVYRLPKMAPGSVGDDLFDRLGWGGREPWGIWGTDTGSLLNWVATNEEDHSLQVTVFPNCVPEQTQTLIIKANGHELGSYEWEECEDWRAEFLIPGDIIDIGWNNMTFEYGFGLAPAELAGNDNPDSRKLAVGFTQLELIRP